MFIYLNKRGQSTLEYGVVIAIIVAALVAMQTYIKRGIQGKLKEASDQVGEQFSPGFTTGNYATTSNVTSSEDVVGGTQPITTSTSNQAQTRTTTENVAVFDQEYWVE